MCVSKSSENLKKKPTSTKNGGLYYLPTLWLARFLAKKTEGFCFLNVCGGGGLLCNIKALVFFKKIVNYNHEYLSIFSQANKQLSDNILNIITPILLLFVGNPFLKIWKLNMFFIVPCYIPVFSYTLLSVQMRAQILQAKLQFLPDCWRNKIWNILRTLSHSQMERKNVFLSVL